MNKKDFLKVLKVGNRKLNVYNINFLEENGFAKINRLPFSIRILVENILRNMDGRVVCEQDVRNIAMWKGRYEKPVDIPFHPARVLMQDFTGVPAIVDLASMRDAVAKFAKNQGIINPMVPTELIIDHSVQVDYFGCENSLNKNVVIEYKRNNERYELLKWAQKSFDNLKVVPPNSGICHQINLEYLSRLIVTKDINGISTAFPDSLVGTDSHTTMINGIGVMGWGVGGIEAEAVMLGQPYYMAIPEVVGVKITGRPAENITGTDIVLCLTKLLRKHQVVEKFVEYFGSGIKGLSIADRATIANMAPEYGATMGFFPVDEKTIDYLRFTGRSKTAEIVRACTKELNLFYTYDADPEYTKVIEFDLAQVEPSVAGPARPQDNIALKNIKVKFETFLNNQNRTSGKSNCAEKSNKNSEGSVYGEGFFKPASNCSKDFGINRSKVKIRDGSIVIAAITSCTNTSNPYVMVGAGLLAKKAVEAGIRVSPFIKTSIAPGSRVVKKYLENSGLFPYLKALGFHITGFGCTTCIGNSGQLDPGIESIISDKNLTVAAVLSGNRNFEARIHQKVRANFLMSPILVIAFALAGRVDIDFKNDPLGIDQNGTPVFLKDIWPEKKKIESIVKKHVKTDLYEENYKTIFNGDYLWQKLGAPYSETFKWNNKSTYIKNPPYFENFTLETDKIEDIENARVLLLLGDSVTTDHISPAGAIPEKYPAGKYLKKRFVDPSCFNSYGSRRGNNDVMTRGTFGNIKIKNKLVFPKEGSYTLKFPEQKEMFVFDAAVEYNKENTPLIIIGGKEYGTGSSRDWAAKGTMLLGIKAVIAESFERIHRSNLVGMGVLPLVFQNSENSETLGLDGKEKYSISGINDITPGKTLKVEAEKKNGKKTIFHVKVRLDSKMEMAYFKNGGILPYMLRKIILT